MLIKYVNHNTIDVFAGIGWETYGRFKIAHKKEGIRLFQISGNNFPNKEKTELEQQFNSNEK